MDGVQAAGSLAPSPAKGKVSVLKKAPGKGVSKKTARKNAAAARKAAGRPKGQGRGRNKTYDDARVQAAYDRQKHLRELYSEVATAIKPVLEDLAESSVKTLIENPEAHKEAAEYHILQRQLDERLKEVLSSAEEEFKTRAMIATREYQLNSNVTEKKFLDSYDDATEDFMDASLRRSNLLANLRQEGADLDLPDTTYTYVEKPNEVIEEQGSWLVFRNGVIVPYPHLLEENKKASAAQAQANQAKPAGKRKAEDQPDGQPDTKKSNGGPSGSAKPENADETPAPLPRHIKGLLDAETDAAGEPASNAASPTPDTDAKVEGHRSKKDVPDLPPSVSEPDRWGVRTVNKRGPKANNRIIVPPPFEFEDYEIGYRDSTNDGSKKATRGTRGKYLNSPNTSNIHLDRRILTYDCLTYEDGDLDPELVQKHNLHGKYGLFLAESRNMSESPKPHVDGTRPIVVITPNGTTLQASRSVRGHKMDTNLRNDAAKDKLASLVAHVCKEDDIDEEDVTTEEMRKRKERIQVAEMVERLPSTTEASEEQPAQQDLNTQETLVDESALAENIAWLLNAASHLEAERPKKATSKQRSSRPYDAVRDVFTNTEPVRSTTPAPIESNTWGLSSLADMAEHVSRQRASQYNPRPEYRLEAPVDYHHPYQPENHHAVAHVEYRVDRRASQQLDHRVEQADIPSVADSMIDPRLLGPANATPPISSSFLHTALNHHQSALPHIAPLPSQVAEPPALAPVGRNPFTGNATASPVLPPLRPPRREKPVEATLAPSPTYVHGPPSDFGPSFGMLQTNSGNFFPPAPARAYHQGYTLEPGPLNGMALHHGYGVLAPAQPGPQLLHPYGQAYRPGSPTMASHTPLAPMPLHMPHGSSVSPPGSSMGLHSPTGHPGSRHRASMSSGSNGSNNAKYRKIAAAPIPHNRPWPANGGQELRLAHYDHKEAIKDYRANEPPPRSGPTTIRGWNVNNVSKGRKSLKKEESEEKESSNITPFINKWSASDRAMG
ncbi:hypothetical protein F5Y17DRAFT_163934 [Xylariaceae sp. FL0594]|nr:hypothetical protein F5Y17DRAFT_163934 [Xylariaceae sp. FL0594]